MIVGCISCTTQKEMVYFNDLKIDSVALNTPSATKYNFESKIQKNDLLWISVGGPNSVDLPALNSGSGLAGQGNAGMLANQGGSALGYLVEADGSIKIPYIGKVQVEGISRLELEEKLQLLFKDYTKDPIVNVRFMNYKISVLGEVARPGAYSIPNERITILEALSLAGDLTVMGERKSVLVIRETKGERTIGYVNLLSKDIFKSPYYFLNTNDVVYVEPVPAKYFARERIPQFITLAASSLSLLLTVITISKL
jgi:polysaccharide export outer membrane protein